METLFPISVVVTGGLNLGIFSVSILVNWILSVVLSREFRT